MTASNFGNFARSMNDGSVPRPGQMTATGCEAIARLSNAVLELGDQLTGPYAGVLRRQVRCLLGDPDFGPRQILAVAAILDEVTEALTTRARGD
jgi:hypothetical protein